MMKKLLLLSLVAMVALGSVATAGTGDILDVFTIGSGGSRDIATEGGSSLGLVSSVGATCDTVYSYGGVCTGFGTQKPQGASLMSYHTLGRISVSNAYRAKGSYVVTVFDSTGGNVANQIVNVTDIKVDVSTPNKKNRFMVRDACSGQWYISAETLLAESGTNGVGVSQAVSSLLWYTVDQSDEINAAIASGTEFPNINTSEAQHAETLSFTETPVGFVPINIDGGGAYYADYGFSHWYGFSWFGDEGICTDDAPPTVSIPAVDPVYLDEVTGTGTVDLTAIIFDELVTVENGPNDLTISWSSVPDAISLVPNLPHYETVTAEFGVVGTYTVTVTVNDGVNADVTADVIIDVVTNLPAVVNAGPATATVYLADGNTLLLGDASVSDDGVPVAATIGWTSEPAEGVSFVKDSVDTSTDINATATFTKSGIYVLTLSADDTESVASDSITVTVDYMPESSIEFYAVEDAYTAQNASDDNEGARNVVQLRDLSAGWARKGYFKFAVGEVAGNIHGADLRLQVYGGSLSDVVSTTTIYSVTYGESGEWFEGDGNNAVADTTGVGITWNTDDLVWGDVLGSITSKLVGGSNHIFALSDVVAESDGNITLGILNDHKTINGNWKAKDGNSTGAQPLLTIRYAADEAVEVSPVDGATGVHPAASLSWTQAAGAKVHEVYLLDAFGVEIETATVLEADRISSDPNVFEWTPSAELTLGENYIWRVDEVFDGISALGEEWSFRVASLHPDIPQLLRPSDAKIDVVDPVEFEWLEGFAADSHDLYVSTNYDLVAALDDSVKIADVTMPYEKTNFDLETTYYWTVVAKDSADGTTWDAPDVFSFTTGTFATLDNFNDGVVWVETSGTVTDVNDFTISGEPVMEFIYDDAGGARSAASLTFAETMDLSSATGRESLLIRVYGQAGNDQDDMYFVLSDGTNTVEVPMLIDGASVDLTLPLYKGYQAVRMDLDDFAPVELSAVTSMGIIIGNGTAAGLNGTVYIDNINTFVSRCLPDMVDGDIVDADCIAGPNDFVVIAQNWMLADEVIIAAPADDTGLVVKFDFEEAAGSATVTSSVTYDGVNSAVATVMDAPILGAAGHTGSAIDFAGAGHVRIEDPAVFASLDNEITISLWCYGNLTDLSGTQLVHTRAFRLYTGSSTLALDSVLPDELGRVIFGNRMGGAWIAWEDATSADWTGAWNHYAFVVDAANNFQAIYCNGLMVAQANADVSGYSFDLAGLSRVDIGTTPNYHGKIDDFRVYNRALGAGEIVTLAGKTSVVQEIVTAADINTDGIVDAEDLAAFASTWLNEILWP